MNLRKVGFAYKTQEFIDHFAKEIIEEEEFQDELFLTRQNIIFDVLPYYRLRFNMVFENDHPFYVPHQLMDLQVQAIINLFYAVSKCPGNAVILMGHSYMRRGYFDNRLNRVNENMLRRLDMILKESRAKGVNFLTPYEWWSLQKVKNFVSIKKENNLLRIENRHPKRGFSTQIFWDRLVDKADRWVKCSNNEYSEKDVDIPPNTIQEIHATPKDVMRHSKHEAFTSLIRIKNNWYELFSDTSGEVTLELDVLSWNKVIILEVETGKSSEKVKTETLKIKVKGGLVYKIYDGELKEESDERVGERLESTWKS